MFDRTPVSTGTFSHVGNRLASDVFRWLYLALLDVRIKYRRTILGPFWITVGVVALLLALGPLFASIQGRAVSDVLPSLYIGLIVWIFLASTIVESTAAISASRSLVLQGCATASGLALRVVARNTIVFAHSAVGCAVVFALLGLKLAPSWPTVVAGLFLVLAFLLPASVIIGVLCARFRDLPHLVSIGMQTLFFLTPIAWLPDLLPNNMRIYIDLNPFAWAISVVRTPLLDGNVSQHFVPQLALTIFVAAVAWLTARLTRSRLALWV
jgi:ABC-type polysaccharide/polyol phosphate export permease